MRTRLDAWLTAKKLAPTRSQAESIIRLGEVTVNGRAITKPGFFVADSDIVKVADKQRYVSRAGLKLASVADMLKLDFRNKVVLDVGSSTGGFTDYSLQHGAKKVFAVDVGTDQLHPSLHDHAQIELHEKTDIRDVLPAGAVVASAPTLARATALDSVGAAPRDTTRLSAVPDIVVMDVSFISLREILPHVATLSGPTTQIVAMVKPQFEAGKHQVNKGVIKNDSVRRQILKDFEVWTKDLFVIIDKRDSDVHGAKGNQERFYLLKKTT